MVFVVLVLFVVLVVLVVLVGGLLLELFFFEYFIIIGTKIYAMTPATTKMIMIFNLQFLQNIILSKSLVFLTNYSLALFKSSAFSYTLSKLSLLSKTF